MIHLSAIVLVLELIRLSATLFVALRAGMTFNAQANTGQPHDYFTARPEPGLRAFKPGSNDWIGLFMGYRHFEASAQSSVYFPPQRTRPNVAVGSLFRPAGRERAGGVSGGKRR